ASSLVTYVAAGQTSYQVTGLTPSTTYKFRVKAINALGYADVNTTDRSVTTDAVGTFAAPPILSASEGSSVTSSSLASYCTDSEGNAPTGFTLTAQSDSSLGCAIL